MDAWDKVRGLDGLPESATRYLIDNGEIPTVDNLYLAKYSAAAATMPNPYGDARDTMGAELGQLRQQMEEVIRGAGYEVNADTLQDARWMIQEELPLTKETFASLEQLKEMQLPLTQEEFVKDAAAAIAEGGNAGDAIPGESENVYRQAVRIQKEFSARTAIDDLEARAQLEEVRLLMSVEANVKLLKSGFSIETAPMEELIQKLRDTAARLQEEYFGTPKDGNVQDAGQGTESVARQRAQLYDQTMALLGGMEDMPAAVAGHFRVQDGTFTLENVA